MKTMSDGPTCGRALSAKDSPPVVQRGSGGPQDQGHPRSRDQEHGQVVHQDQLPYHQEPAKGWDKCQKVCDLQDLWGD